MGIGRDDVNRFMLQKPRCHPRRTLSPEARQRIRRDLHRASQLHKLDDPLRSLPQNRIAFRMRDDRRHPAISQP